MQILETRFGAYQELCLINSKDSIRLCLLPELGGTLRSLSFRNNNEWSSIIWTTEDPDLFMAKHVEAFSGFKLSPFPNRINGGHYSFNCEKFQLPCNEPVFPHALHGFVYSKTFQIERSPELIKLTLRYDGATEGYPFPYLLTLSYSLQDSGVTITTEVRNLGNTTMPIGDGWHPYFDLGGKVDDWALTIPGKEYFLTDEKFIPTLNTAGFQHQDDALIGDIELNHCFEIDQTETNIGVTKISDPNTGLEVEIWQKSGIAQYNYVQYYIPKERNCIAVEPMTCIPDAFNNKVGLISLAPGESQYWTFGITIIH